MILKFDNSVYNVFIETTLESWNDLFLFDQKFLSQFIFRGQANADWNLSTTIERFVNRMHPNSFESKLPAMYENKMIEDFAWRYPLYENNKTPGVTDYIEWLSIMQHYGASTRLLDFTQSIYIALYMAIYDGVYDNAAIWALNINATNNKSLNLLLKELNENSVSDKKFKEYTYQRANNAIGENMRCQSPSPELFAFSPKRCNERLYRQQGLFVMPATLEKSFDENLRQYIEVKSDFKISLIQAHSYDKPLPDNKISLLKINIPKSLNSELIKALNSMNITSDALFPGLEGLAKSVSYLRY